MTQATKKWFENKMTMVVDYILNGGVEDSVAININNDVTGEYAVQTIYNSNTPYSFKNKDKEAIFSTFSEACKERSRRAKEWEAKFKSLFL